MKSPKLMFLYAGFLLICSLAAFMLARDKSHAGTALYVGGGAAALMIVCSLMARQIYVHRVIGMIGIHFGLVLPVLFAIAFGQRTVVNYMKEDWNMAVTGILAVMTIVSVAAFVSLLNTRPPPEKRTSGK